MNPDAQPVNLCKQPTVVVEPLVLREINQRYQRAPRLHGFKKVWWELFHFRKSYIKRGHRATALNLQKVLNFFLGGKGDDELDNVIIPKDLYGAVCMSDLESGISPSPIINPNSFWMGLDPYNPFRSGSFWIFREWMNHESLKSHLTKLDFNWK